MKKVFLLFAALFMFAGFVKSQTVLYQDNLDSYTLNSFMGVNNATWWTTWSGLPGSDEDMQITNVQSHTTTMSGVIDEVSAASDCVLKLGDKTSGIYELKWYMYVPTGKCGYYNIQHYESPGVEWAVEVYLRTDGSIELLEGGVTLTGTYPKDTWFEVRHLINIGTDNIDCYINGTLIGTWPFSNEAGATGGTNQLGGVDFFAGALSGSGELPVYYVDDVSFIQDPVGINEFKKDGFVIYPNPTTDKLNIVTSENINNVTINDISGKVVYQGISKTIDVSAFSNGIYFVKIESAQGTINSKFVKK